MAVSSYMNEADKVKQLWDELSHNRIVFELNNHTISPMRHMAAYQSHGEQKGGWSTIPANNADATSTGRGASVIGNIGACAYRVQPKLERSQNDFALLFAWDYQFGKTAKFAIGLAESCTYNYCENWVQKFGVGISGSDAKPISGTPSGHITMGNGTIVTYQPSTDPFVIDILYQEGEKTEMPADDGSFKIYHIEPPELTAAKHKELGEALIANAMKLK